MVEKTFLHNGKRAAVGGWAGGGKETRVQDKRQLLAPTYVDLLLPARLDLLGSQNFIKSTSHYRSISSSHPSGLHLVSKS